MQETFVTDNTQSPSGDYSDIFKPRVVFKKKNVNPTFRRTRNASVQYETEPREQLTEFELLRQRVMASKRTPRVNDADIQKLIRQYPNKQQEVETIHKDLKSQIHQF